MTSVAVAMTSDELSLRLQQQELVAQFGIFALEPGPLQRLLDEAVRVAAAGLDVRLAKIARYRPEQDDLLIVAGVGWHAGVVGHGTLGAGLDSPAGYALQSGVPTLANHLPQERRFRVPALLIEHGVQSAMNVVIGPPGRDAFGVLEVDSTQRLDFQAPDTAFLQSLSNVLAAGLLRIEAEQVQAGLLQDKDLLMREVHHRVSNSLQLVRTMLGLQARAAEPQTRAQLDMAASRIMSIAAVHRRLYQEGSVVEGDAAAYLAALVGDLRDMLEEGAAGRSILLDAEPLQLPADHLTPLGLVVSELVTNAVKYGAGRVGVTVRRVVEGIEVVVEDEGAGFGPDFVVQKRQGLGMRLIATLARSTPEKAIAIDPAVPHGRVTVILRL